MDVPDCMEPVHSVGDIWPLTGETSTTIIAATPVANEDDLMERSSGRYGRQYPLRAGGTLSDSCEFFISARAAATPFIRMSCHGLYRSDSLEIASCVGDASRRDAVAMHFPLFEAHFQDDGAYFLHGAHDTVLVDAHHVELRAAGSTHTYSRPVVPTDRGMSIRFSLDWLGGPSGCATNAIAPFRSRVVPLGWRRFRQLRALRRTLEQPRVGSAVVEQQIARLIAPLVRSFAHRGSSGALRAATSYRRQRAVEHAKAFLIEHIHERPTLIGVASIVDYAPHHLARVFRDETGLSVHRYLMELRLRQAAARLDEGATNLSSLALDLGFSSQSHFTTAFRGYFGCTPGAYRG